MWDDCGMARNETGPRTRRSPRIPELREEFWKNVRVPGGGDEFNQSLEKAGRVADFLELGELMCRDALTAKNPAAATSARSIRPPEGEALRDDEKFCHAAAWEYQGDGKTPVRNVEPLDFEYVHLAQRSYK